MATPASLKVIVFGAAGKVGSRVVRSALNHNHQVTAFVRDRQKLLAVLGQETFDKVNVVVGDVYDLPAVKSAIAGHHAAVNTALPIQNLAAFTDAVKNILDSADVLLPPKRVWIFGGVAALTYPKIEKMGVDYGAPAVYQMHKRNFELIQKYDHLDWSFACPGPMIDTPTPGKLIENVKVSVDYMPFKLTPEEEQIPAEQGIKILSAHMAEITIPYEDVANVTVSNLSANGLYRHKRVGYALPDGMKLEKTGWNIEAPTRR